MVEVSSERARHAGHLERVTDRTDPAPAHGVEDHRAATVLVVAVVCGVVLVGAMKKGATQSPDMTSSCRGFELEGWRGP